MKNKIRFTSFFFSFIFIFSIETANASYRVWSAWWLPGSSHSQIYRLYWGTTSGVYTNHEDFGTVTNLSEGSLRLGMNVIHISTEVPDAGVTYYFIIKSVDENGNEGGASEEYPWWVQRENDTKPFISAIPNQHFLLNSVSNAINFTIGDDQTPVDEIEVWPSSWDLNILMPATNMVVTGTGTNRTIYLTPRSGQTGKTRIEIVVVDNNLSVGVSKFDVIVSETPKTTAPKLLRFFIAP